MRAAAIFVAFFLLFTCASIAVPVPMFPGNMISALLKIPPSGYTPYFEAFANGLMYGFITWIVFFLINKRIDRAFSPNSDSLREKEKEI